VDEVDDDSAEGKIAIQPGWSESQPALPVAAADEREKTFAGHLHIDGLFSCL
jgi:hypothetical protein